MKQELVVPPHPEIPVKVTAWVDEGIAPLVAALNEYDEIMTLDSCQGDDDRGAYVLFRAHVGESLRLVRDLATALVTHTDYLLRAEWRPGADEPLIELACPPDRVGELARLVSAFRTRESLGGT